MDILKAIESREGKGYGGLRPESKDSPEEIEERSKRESRFRYMHKGGDIMVYPRSGRISFEKVGYIVLGGALASGIFMMILRGIPSDRNYPLWEREISITYPEGSSNGEFMDFLHGNEDKVVRLETYINMDLSDEGSHMIYYSLNDEGIWVDDLSDVEKIDGEDVLVGMEFFLEYPWEPLPLDGLYGESYIAFNFSEERDLYPSYGGTGVMGVPVSGNFRVTITHHSGPSTVYHLGEVDPGSVSGK